MSAPNSRFVRACRCQPVDVTPIWLMRQAGRYMAEYRAVRKQHSILEICKTPEIAAEVTITAAEKLDVDAAIIFADLLLPLLLPVEPMGLKLRYEKEKGPIIGNPVRTTDDVDSLSTANTDELGYVGEAVQMVVRALAGKVPVIGFIGAPFTLASYVIEGGGSRNYVHTKKMMYTNPAAWQMLMEKLVEVLAAYSADQVQGGADALQIFDSWVGCLGVEDYRQYVLPHTRDLVQKLKATGVPIIYFGTDTATLLPAMKETGAQVMGVDWRIPLDEAWRELDHEGAIQGNLDPVLLFADQEQLRSRTEIILRQAQGRPGHIFNLGHGILPETPVDNVRALVDFVRELSSKYSASGAAR